jgi:acetyl esterase
MLVAIRRFLLISLLRLPRPLMRLLAGKPAEIEGRRLDLQMQWLCRLAAAAMPEYPPVSEVPRVRADMEALASALSGERGRDVAREDRRIEGRRGSIRVRVYRPGGSDLPVLVYYHGGGWVIGSIESHDGLCAQLAMDARCVVVSVDYRMGPEHPFPAAVDDALDAFFWVRDRAQELGGDPSRVAVGGDSAGGNLSAVVSQQCAVLGERKPSSQLLIYPATDLSRESPSYATYGEGFYLTRARIEWFKDLYVPVEERADPRASPLLNEELAGQPPAHVVTAGFDPLRDEGRAYARALEAAGVFVTYENCEGVIHGFANMAGLMPAARAAYDDMVNTFRALLHERAA